MGDRLRVLTIIHGFHPLRGGAETAALEIATRLASAGVKQTVLTAGFKGLPREEILGGVRVHRALSFSRSLGPAGPGGMLVFALAALPLTAALARQSEIVHAHFTIPAGLVALFLRRTRGLPYVVTLHGSDVPGYNARRPFARLYGATRPIVRAVWRGAGRVVAVTDPLARCVRDLEATSPIEVIPNGVDTRRFAPSPEKNREQGRILLVGRLIPLKGHAVFVRALALVRKRWRGPLSVEIVGAGPELDSLRREAAALGLLDVVEISGFVPFEELPFRYSRASLFVMPSLNDAAPLALLEAMASGLPLVASGVGGIPELLSGCDAELVPPGDEEALAAAILRVLSNPERGIAMGRQGRTRAREFDWDAIAGRYKDLYERILSGPLRP
jgi:glycosyltransferase involved in cell wall biosynthesis